ncbi:tubulin--tyrosine ligase [Dispira parvispora]|uniref:Tubulin--tyrosine ligase n=1 Tax=Dispira parvispora TaxID=1520584 RepID=A0A9W8AX89_9FUNG|nr:tubulin--tyrosine ligase [Dispira parvispora]
MSNDFLRPLAVVGLSEPYVRDLLVASYESVPGRWKVIVLADTETDLVTLVTNKVQEHAKACEKANGATLDPAVRRVHLWLEYEDVDWDLVQPHHPLASQVYLNTYCIRKGLIRKAQMAFNIKKYCSKHPTSVLNQTVPDTFIFELDHLDYLDEALNENYEIAQALEANETVSRESGLTVDAETGNTTQPDAPAIQRFILKPSLTGRGAGIHIFETLPQLESILGGYFEDSDESDSEDNDDEVSITSDYNNSSEVDNSPEGAADLLQSLDLSANGAYGATNQGCQIREWVIQRYIDQPLLLNGHRKFHIRAYVLAVGGVEVFLWEDMLSLFAGYPYHNQDLNDTSAHLTNTCLQTDRLDFDETTVIKRFWQLHEDPDPTLIQHELRRLTKTDLDRVFQQIKLILRELFDAVTSEMTTFQTRSQSFEMFGFDLLVDNQLQTHLLEANAYPDFKQTGSQLQDIVQGFFQATVELVNTRSSSLGGLNTWSSQDTPAAVHKKLHPVFYKPLMGGT